MNTTHTPGPWQAHGVHVEDNHHHRCIADCLPKHETRIAAIDALKNATLCAAAPDLLYALKEAKAILETAKAYFPKSIKNRHTFSLLNVLANAVDPAIAKAEGGSK